MKGEFSSDWNDFLNEWNNNSSYITAHTSGSTGTPKEIRLLKSDMLVSAQATNKRFNITDESQILCPLSPSYIAGKMMMVRAIAANCRLITEKPSNAPLQKDYGKIDLLAVVPSQCPAIIANPFAHNQLKNIIVGGAPVSSSLEMNLMKMPWKTFSTYGMTETCSHVAIRKAGNFLYEAMPGIRFSTDARECLVINADKMSFRQLITNDVVELESDTTFRWIGRFDNAINSGGVKFHPEQLESLLKDVFHAPFFFKGIPHEKWGEAVAMVIATNGIAETEAEKENLQEIAMELCRKNLPHYAFPTKFIMIDSLPSTSNGKLYRKQIF